ncbi:hypothetical protein [Acinetobacter dispersus]|uniref:hypothetical protein n=1 Tax=Acinetobacter dispersus TaxID=70348 RepID=UPI001F4A32C5|nr:hypothetical protein [Acinetobacter dispersus]MCH7391836.1 hypothetical protein [Acinetobacter dispersus]
MRVNRYKNNENGRKRLLAAVNAEYKTLHPSESLELIQAANGFYVVMKICQNIVAYVTINKAGNLEYKLNDFKEH